jgi:hypothetical protein
MKNRLDYISSAKFIGNPNFFADVTRKDASIPLIIFDEIHKFKDWKFPPPRSSGNRKAAN